MSGSLGGRSRLGAASPPNHIGFVAGIYYQLFYGSTTQGTAWLAADKLGVRPFRVDQELRFSTVRGRVITAGTSSSAKLAIWRNNPLTCRPAGTPICADNTGVTTQAGPQNRSFSVGAQILRPDWYWIGLVSTGTSPAWSHISTSDLGFVNLIGSSAETNANSALVQCLSTAFTYSGDLSALDLTGATWAFESSMGFPTLSVLTE